jgi:hypothetical protein
MDRMSGSAECDEMASELITPPGFSYKMGLRRERFPEGCRRARTSKRFGDSKQAEACPSIDSGTRPRSLQSLIAIH